jgi:tetratricopeptide (TPR) repeat protein
VPEADDALARYRQAVAARPDDAAAQFALGTALWPAGHRQEAIEHLTRAVALDPSHIDARNNLGNALLELGRSDDAIAQYRAALAMRPNAVELHYNLGNALLTSDHPGEAEPCYRAALALNPDHAGAHNNLGNALRSQGKHEDAISEYRAALSLRPEFYGSVNNIGSALLALHRADEAIPYFRDALRARPDYAEASNNLGGALLALDRPAEALEWFRRAFEQDPGQVQARFGEAMALLVMGNFRDGWRAFESRWLDPKFREDTPDFTDQTWRGEESVAGRTIYLHAEQGLGDTIQFVRYAKLLRARGARVGLEVQAPLVPLMRDLADVVLAAGDEIPPYELRCPLLSLPLAFGTEPATIPADVPYLHADPARRAAWAERLGTRTRMRVGVAWSGAPDHPEDAIRSIPAAQFVPPLAATGVELHVIQKEIRDTDAAAAAGLIVHAGQLTDFAETAALLSELDLVITADTSVAHLAGALGVPTWILLQFSSDFRWLRNRTDSPWYPTVRLFRQRDRNAWPPVIAAVAAELAKLAR